MARIRLVLPEPHGPPISACGESSASTSVHGRPSANPIGARRPGASRCLPHSAGGGSRSRTCRPGCASPRARRRSRGTPPSPRRGGSGGSGTTVTCGPVIDVLDDPPGRRRPAADGLDRRVDRHRDVEQHERRSRRPARRAHPLELALVLLGQRAGCRAARRRPTAPCARPSAAASAASDGWPPTSTRVCTRRIRSDSSSSSLGGRPGRAR